MSSENKPVISAQLPIIASLAQYIEESLVILDVGCRWGFADAWSIFGSHATLIGFDPDAAECERLKIAMAVLVMYSLLLKVSGLTRAKSHFS